MNTPTAYETESCTAKSGFSPAGDAECEITIGNIKYHIKSVFADKVKLEDALRNIALKKQNYSDLPKAGKAV